ncbi:MAG: bifunctional hydroxymethylpyrimidine kinase/phosphomethylpyrimidine kinase [bacterium]|jgi:hydroxymethylpyrimidine/phosphomethylpyrimidine kinase|nr:bifunctional hydroxymethylpyrimidine kinase/phosphomethylpyrimidine kinase [candidate division KSB1 bacterium]MDH7559659.1 bifunctional hydroxymethylpyrimidine kinase/phosphomethylpyrimidine kinase [bacterium]
MVRALTIAGSDSGGGAGIQADLKTFCAFKVYGMSVITAVTAQNTMGVHGIFALPAEFVAEQLHCVLEDIGADAAKTGMLSNVQIVRAVAAELRRHQVRNVVVDPVMLAKRGEPLLQPEARQALVEELLPLAEVVTPNIPEAEALAEMHIESLDDMKRAAERILARGARAVVVKGGHRTSDATDVLFDGQAMLELRGERLANPHTHGSGCTFSAAIAAGLAKGKPLVEAVRGAKAFVTKAIAHAEQVGNGIAGLNHFVEP